MTIPPEVIARLLGARSVTVLTGAGVSAESGIPTFREAQTGLWAQFRPEELATPEAFRRHPRRVWEWYAWRRQRVREAQPNAGHRALVALERRFSRFQLVTQNVDGLHQRAGSRSVIELHGNISRVKCFDEGTTVETWDEAGEVPPRCPRCGAWLRPDVVWFGESLPPEALDAAVSAAVGCDVFLAVGTSALVYPAAELPLQAAARGAMVVEVNPDRTPLSDRATVMLRGPAGEVLPELVQALESADREIIRR